MLPKAVRDLTQELTRLPGIGPKTAQRLSIHLLRQPRAVVARFADWERERQRLLDALKQKDGMVAMLSSAFQGSLKKH